MGREDLRSNESWLGLSLPLYTRLVWIIGGLSFHRWQTSWQKVQASELSSSFDIIVEPCLLPQISNIRWSILIDIYLMGMCVSVATNVIYTSCHPSLSIFMLFFPSHILYLSTSHVLRIVSRTLAYPVILSAEYRSVSHSVIFTWFKITLHLSSIQPRTQLNQSIINTVVTS